MCSPHLYASFGTFCTKIGHLLETQGVFEVCLEIDKSLLSKENVLDFGIFPNVLSLTVPRLIDQFGRKMCQKKRKDVDYTHLYKKICRFAIFPKFKIFQFSYFFQNGCC